MPGRVRKPRLSHVDDQGRVRMVDVGEKPVTAREAVARGTITISATARRLIAAGQIKKGDPLQTARLAGIMAAKRTSELIPLCHPLALTHVSVELTKIRAGFEIVSRVRTSGQTGVEMEALTAVAVAALTIYDMVKAVDKTMVIGEICLLEKRGGRSGAYVRTKNEERRTKNGTTNDGTTNNGTTNNGTKNGIEERQSHRPRRGRGAEGTAKAGVR